MTFNDDETQKITSTKEFLVSLIKKDNLLSDVKKNIVIAGGFFANTLQGSPYKDIDIFVLNEDINVYNTLAQRFFALRMDGWTRSNVMNYSYNTMIVDVINNDRTKAQYILTKYNTREELLNHFDYKHCKVSYVPEEDKLYINRETYDCIRDKILKVNNKEGYQKWREDKFIREGWTLEKTVKDELLDAHNESIRQSYELLKKRMSTFADPYLQTK